MNGRTPPPSAEQQLAFLTKLQRLYAEGDFTATYKFALLISLADLAVEAGSDDGDELQLTVRQIAERFIGLYWRHVTPYAGQRSVAEPNILSQNIGAPAALLTAVAEFRAATGASSVLQARALPSYSALMTRVATVVSAQPLNYLQNFGGATDPFLYERTGPGRVTLKAGVAYCLRRFYPLVQQLSRSHWVEHIKANRRNQPVLGDGADLEDFLFATSRQSLQVMGLELRKLDGARCFYCGHGLDLADVDHFVPFSLYPRDLVGNFVLAHPACNRSKSDTLAARPHLERWLERLTQRSSQLQEIGAAAGVQADQSTLHNWRRGVTAMRWAAVPVRGRRPPTTSRWTRPTFRFLKASACRVPPHRRYRQVLDRPLARRTGQRELQHASRARAPCPASRALPTHLPLAYTPPPSVAATLAIATNQMTRDATLPRRLLPEAHQTPLGSSKDIARTR